VKREVKTLDKRLRVRKRILKRRQARRAKL
jgi:hypothetical protein